MVQDLIDARDNLEAEIAALMAAATIHPTHSEGGRSTDHDGHLATLVDQLDKLNAMIIKRQGAQISRTQVLT
jgi:hypothetical protein